MEGDLLVNVDESIMFVIVRSNEFGLTGGGAKGEFGDYAEINIFDVAVLVT